MRAFLFLLIAAVLTSSRVLAVTAYDPMSKPAATPPAPVDLVVKDEGRSREIPIRVYLPAEQTAAPLVLFSPGLGGSREGYAFLAMHWAGRGYAVVVLQHPGSDSGVWKGKPAAERMAALRDAASVENFALRVKDVPVVLDQLEQWNKEPQSAQTPLGGRLDFTRVAMAGHSFGAVTTQAVSGQSFRGGAVSFTDPRIKVALIMSPSAPRLGDPGLAFHEVKIPWFLMTGTNDVSPVGDIDAKARLKVFPALPPGNKFQLILDGAAHSVFAGHTLPGDTGQENPNHQRAILALSSAFLDGWLRKEEPARAWLEGDEARTVLQAKDVWEKK